MKRRFGDHLRGLFVAIAMLFAWVFPVCAADPVATVMLVATPELSDPIYGATVLVARPIGNGQFLRFIVNKPTSVTLAWSIGIACRKS